MTYTQSRPLSRGHFGDTALGLCLLRPKASNNPTLSCTLRLGHSLSRDVHGDFGRAVPQEFLHNLYVFPVTLQQGRVGVAERMHPIFLLIPALFAAG
jgi:hypothetical protein